MTIAAGMVESAPSLSDFFARLDDCRNKTEHVHGLHPYPAKFIPHIPRALIRTLARSGDVVLDPMCGSGTTLVEATLAGHQAMGADLNPIAVLVSRAKTTPLPARDHLRLRNVAAQLEARAIRLIEGGKPLDTRVPDFHNREKWFESNVARELAFAQRLIDHIESRAARELARCAFSSIVVGVSNQESETRWCAKPKKTTDGATLLRLSAKLLNSLDRLSAYESGEPAEATVFETDARHLPIQDGSVGAIVTSPPYANSHDYYLYNKLRMFWLGYDVASVQAAEIGSRNRHSDMKEDVSTYICAMSEVLGGCHRVLREGGNIAIVVGDAVIRGHFFDMRQIFDEIARSRGFVEREAYDFGHRKYNASFQRGFGTNREKRTHVLIYEAL